ncbi:hypothetical protein [Tardiphaga sp. 841_E9_N1_2]|uniref:hypothetical protein n=1 Tax=Tardiphaga sp. 841_E9_N1_2 TaxID=3240762 RepID=UPI003F2502EB
MSKVEGNRQKTGGRQKGTPNKTTALLKDAILQAAENAGGGKNGLVAYLEKQASANPGPFMALLGKVLPMQLTGADGDSLIVEVVRYSDS